MGSQGPTGWGPAGLGPVQSVDLPESSSRCAGDPLLRRQRGVGAPTRTEAVVVRGRVEPHTLAAAHLAVSTRRQRISFSAGAGPLRLVAEWTPKTRVRSTPGRATRVHGDCPDACASPRRVG